MSRILPALTALAFIGVSACASAPPLAPPARLQQHDFLALRDFGVRAAPSMEADEIARVAVGERFRAEADLAPGIDWRYVRLSGGPAGYVFGLPMQPTE